MSAVHEQVVMSDAMVAELAGRIRGRLIEPTTLTMTRPALSTTA